jgi:tetratricopeptide (TPR) repeat protein
VVNPDSRKRATGWVVDRARRQVLTSAEVAGSREALDVIFPRSENGQIVADPRAYADRRHASVGCVLAVDARRNLALLETAELPDAATEAELAAEAPQPGDPLHLIGCPDKVEALWVYTAAWLRQRGRARLGQATEGEEPAVLVVQAPLVEGEAGGPVLDGRGAVVGVAGGKAGPQQVAYCLEAAEVRAFLDEQRARARPRTAAELCARGEVFARARLYDRAIVDFTEALKADPVSAPAHAGRGRAYLLRGDAGDAVRDCTEALRLEPRNVAALVCRAEARLVLEDDRAAQADCDAALAVDPKCAPAYAARALARLRRGDGGGARADCDEALWHDAKSAAAYHHRGLVALRSGDREAARRDLDRALDLDPRRSSAWRDRGELHWRRGDVAAALADWTRAVELDPGDARAHLGRGRALLVRGDEAAALAALHQAVRLRPQRTLTDWLGAGD